MIDSHNGTVQEVEISMVPSTVIVHHLSFGKSKPTTSTFGSGQTFLQNSMIEKAFEKMIS